LGNAFTGLADGIEAVYFNSAGLANLDYYAASYSNGQGFTFITNDYTTDDFAILIPTFSQIGKFAISVDRLGINDFNFGYNLYRLHFARNLLDNFSIGTSINYYYFYSDLYSTIANPDGIDEEVNGSSFDLSLSLLYLLPINSINGISSEMGFGVQLQNIFNTDLNYSKNLGLTEMDNSAEKHQTLRLGISNTIIPELKKIADLIPLKIAIVADAVFYGSKYDFTLWQPNIGIEIKLLEILSLRYGRENQIEIKDTYSNSPQHPVKRYGLGLSIPINKIFKQSKRFELLFDYSYSDWDKFDETKPIFNFIGDDIPVRESFSLGIIYNY
jgi:hypothetical protein